MQRPDRREAAFVAALLFVPLHRAELDTRLTQGVVAREASGHEVVCAVLDVQPDLVAHVALEPGPRDHGVHRVAQLAEHGYTSPARLLSAPAMMRTVRFQS